MNLGALFLILAVVLFFFAAVGVAFLPNPAAWGLVCLALGILCAGVKIGG